jgi:geranylgeranyl reductase family protein
MRNYDVVIVGAGPAGLSCAEKLAKSGMKALLLEQNKIIGPKICAGGLTPHGVRFLNLPKKTLERKFSSAFFCTPHQETRIKFKQPMAAVEREKLGQWQLKKLEKTKVEIETSAHVDEIGKGWLSVNSTEKIGFCYLVGADGSASIVRRFLKLPSEDIFLGLQYLVPNFSSRRLETHFDSKLFRSGYAWVFPHKKYASIGCGCNPKHLSPKDLHKNFHTWLKREKIDFSSGKYQAFPINADYRGHQFGNIFLAGDAAGMVSELTGEGILPALISGEAVAELILGETQIAEKKIKKLLLAHNFHKRVVKFWERLGWVRGFGFELTALFLRNKWIARKFLEKIY